GERLHSTSDEDRDRLEQFPQLARCAWIKLAISATGHTGDLAKNLLYLRVVAFLEHESRHTEASELTRLRNQFILVLFEGVPDKDQRANLEQPGFLLSVNEDL